MYETVLNCRGLPHLNSMLCKPHYLEKTLPPPPPTHFFQLPLPHPSQRPQGHVKLLASAPAVGGVAEVATSLLADVGVIELAVPTETAVLTSVQPAQDQVSGKIRLLR